MVNGREVVDIESRFLATTFQKFPVVLDRGFMATLWDADGKEYVDCMSGYGVALVGHSNPAVVDAVTRQANRLITCHGSLYSEPRARLAERLVHLAPGRMDRVFFSNSGAEAVECALKAARRATGRKGFVAMQGSYHGKTMGALSVTWNQKYRDPFQPLIGGVDFAPFGDTRSLTEKVTGETAAVIVEPIQGESGVKLPPEGFLGTVRKICSEKGAVMIVDEIQTGLGRTGRLWACQHFGVEPDIVCMAKGLAGGLPMGATVGKEEFMAKLKPGDHTSTFGGNPISSAAALATLDYIEQEGLVQRAERLGELFLGELQGMAGRHPSAREARGMGLMLALELRNDIRELLSDCIERGLITLYSGRNILRLLPPLVITREQILRAVAILDDTLNLQDSRLGSG